MRTDVRLHLRCAMTRYSGFIAVVLVLMLSTVCTAAEFRQLQQIQQGGTGIMVPSTQPAPSGGTGLMVPSAQPAPDIRAVTPTVVVQGNSYTLQLIGANLQPGMALDFGQGIQVVGTPILNGPAGTVNVQVTPGAAVGPHDVKITYGGKTVTAIAKLMVNASAQPDIISISPQTLTRGKQAVVTLTGTNLKTGMTLNMGDGIEVSSVQQVGDKLIIAGVDVGQDAPLGPHDVMINYGANQPKKATANVIVVSGGGIMPSVEVVPGAVPIIQTTVLSLTPNTWETGKDYSATLTGIGFADGMELRFGNGVEVKDLKVYGPTNATVDVSVADDAPAGARVVETRATSQANWKATTATAWVIKPKLTVKVQAPQIKFPTPDLNIFQKGVIYLVDPFWGWDSVEVKTDHGIPQLNDQTVFTWKEKNPGVAQWFEFRILNKKGDVLLTKKVDDAYYRPDPAFIKELWDLMSPGGKVVLNAKRSGGLATSGKNAYNKAKAGNLTPGQGVTTTDKSILPPTYEGQKLTNAGAAQLAPQGGGSSQPTYEQQRDQYLKDHAGDIDLYWEVAGYRQYNKNSMGSENTQQPAQNGGQVAQSGQSGQVVITAQNQALAGAGLVEKVDVEVEKSDTWPLGLHSSKPTGMACGQGFGSITMHKASGDPKDLAMHPFDSIALDGNFDLSKSPWAVSVQNMFDTSTQYLLDVKGYKFNNVFIDWGDGTVVPLYCDTEPGKNDEYYPNTELTMKVSHKYAWVDQFTIRVYVLPSDDTTYLNDIADANGKDNPLYDMLNMLKKAEAAQPYVKPLYAGLDTPLSDAGGLYAAAGIGQGLPTGFGQPAQDMPQGTSGAKKFSPATGSAKLTQTKPVAPPVMNAMDRAFMVYCNTVDIQDVMDTDATGPLHLDSIEITSFSGQGGQKKSKAVKSNVEPVADTGGISAQVSKTLKMSESGAKKLTANENAIAKAGLNIQADAKATTCDEGLIATAELKYYGKGRARITWHVDGVSFSEEHDLASEPRKGLPEDKSKWGEPKRSLYSVTSPILPVDKAGLHKITVDAVVLPGNPDLEIDATMLMGMLGGSGKTGGKTIPPSESNTPKGAPNTAVMPATQGGKLKVGVLSGAKFVTTDKPMVMYASPPIISQAAMVVLQPPYYVKSDDKSYLVVQPDPQFPCVFHFPVAGGGYFRVGSLQGNVNKDAKGAWTGHGTLFFKLPADATSYKDYFTDIQINGWVTKDDVDVVTGSINLAGLGIGIDSLPGMKAKLGKLVAAKPGDDMVATMDVTVGSPELMLVSNSQPKTWGSVPGTLSPDGDWFIPGQKLEDTYIGWSKFKISSDDVALDLSHSESAGGKAASWVGIDLGSNAKLYPYLMDLQNLSIPASGWGISGGGLSGTASMGAYNHDLGEGSVHFDSLDVKCANNKLDATYNGVKIHVPWPDLMLTSGAAKLSYGPEGADIKFDFASAGSSKYEYGPVDMTISNVEFKKGKQNWGISADTVFNYWDGQNKFATGNVTGLFFDMMGLASFEDGAPNHSFPLSGKSKLGKAPLDLLSVTVIPSSSSGGDRLKFNIITKLSISKKLESKQVQVNYDIKRSAGNYYAVGPYNSPFTLTVEYPQGNPVSKSAISPEVTSGGAGAQGGSGYASRYGGPLYASLDLPGYGTLTDAGGPMLMASGGSAKDTYVGSVNTKMFGMAQEITALFRLGYVGDDDYWITYASYSPHLQIFPGVELETIGGGLGYNFGKDAYTTDPKTAAPDIGAGMIYSADLRVRDPAGTAYEAHGVLTIIPGQSLYRMDFLDISILGIKNIGQGYFQYGDSHFEGQVWGGFDMFGGLVKLTIPQGSTGLYFGSDKWYIKGEGDGHMILLDTTVKMALGSEYGLSLSGGFKWSTGKICLGVISGRFDMSGSVGFQVPPTPSLHVDASLSASVKVCAGCYHPCGSLGAGISLHLDLPPLSGKACVDLDCPWPIPDYSGCFGI
jgi:Quinohemoprotein amine dehydrogenase, alpha subunit domain III